MQSLGVGCPYDPGLLTSEGGTRYDTEILGEHNERKGFSEWDYVQTGRGKD